MEVPVIQPNNILNEYKGLDVGGDMYQPEQVAKLNIPEH